MRYRPHADDIAATEVPTKYLWLPLFRCQVHLIRPRTRRLLGLRSRWGQPQTPGRPIYQSEIVGATPYNTYVIPGLPPAPICNPGKDSLSAVLRPEDSGDLYFVANGKGGHVFAATEAEHLRNVAAWRAIERAKDPEAQPPPVEIPKPAKRKRARAG